MQSNSLFKFMMVRPPQDISGEDLSSSNTILQFEKAGVVPPFATNAQSQLGAQGTMEQYKTIARDFIDSPSFISGWDYESDILEYLRLGHNFLRNFEGATMNSSAKTQLKAAMGKEPVDVLKLGAFAELYENLWGSLYAAKAVQSSESRDMSTVMDAIRTIKLIQKIYDETVDNKTIQQMLRARPMIARLAKFEAPEAPAQNPEPPGPSLEEARRQKVTEAREKQENLSNARKEIRKVYDRQLKQESAGLRNVTPIKDEFDVENEHGNIVKLEVIRDDEEAGFSEKFTAASISDLSNATKTLLTQNGIDLAWDSVSEVVTGLDREVRKQSNIQFTNRARKRTLPNGKRGVVQIPDSRINRPDGVLGEMGGPAAANDEPNVGSIQPVGIGDLQVVEETLIGYEMGEIAYVENVMESEHKERVHRTLDRSEETYSFESSSSTETTHDLTTAERYELQSEISKTINTSTSLDLGTSISASYGPVKATADANFATSRSSSQSKNTSSNYAKEITEQTVTKIQESVKESQTTTVVSEVEVTNTHGFDNREGTEHVVGIYRYLDKKVRCDLYNYGKRLMFEFIVPEPASFYIHSKAQALVNSIEINQPADDIMYMTPADLTEDNYLDYLALYQVEGLAPPPPEKTWVSLTLNHQEADPPSNNNDYRLKYATDNTMEVPDGYVATGVYVKGRWTYFKGLNRHSGMNDAWKLGILVCTRSFNKHSSGSDVYSDLNNVTGTIPVSVKAVNLGGYSINIMVRCERSDTAMAEWQIATFEALMNAYNSQKDEYDAALASLQATSSTDWGTGYTSLNRQIEKNELQRNCLTLLTNQKFDGFDAIDENGAHDYPELDISEAVSEADFIRFFQHSFEWDQLTYTFYPYFWGRKANWIDNLAISDSDDDFTHFLQAGAARVVVPVRPNFDEAMLHYLETGELWNGGESPAIDDDLYLSIITELLEAQDMENDGDYELLDSWEVSVPTTLVMLQEGNSLPELEGEA